MKRKRSVLRDLKSMRWGDYPEVTKMIDILVVYARAHPTEAQIIFDRCLQSRLLDQAMCGGPEAGAARIIAGILNPKPQEWHLANQARDRQIIVERQKGRSLSWIAERWNLSRGRVWQICKRA
jgi:hypothetical protein